MILAKNNFTTSFLFIIASIAVGLSGCDAQDSIPNRKINLRDSYFGSHFMIDLESMNIVFDTTLISNFQRLGENRDWINTETSTGENVLKLYNQITTQGEYNSPIYSYSSGINSNGYKNTYPCRCSKGYFWKDYVLIYCEIVISDREKLTQNLFFENDNLIFSQDSGELLVNTKD